MRKKRQGGGGVENEKVRRNRWKDLDQPQRKSLGDEGERIGEEEKGIIVEKQKKKNFTSFKFLDRIQMLMSLCLNLMQNPVMVERRKNTKRKQRQMMFKKEAENIFENQT